MTTQLNSPHDAHAAAFVAPPQNLSASAGDTLVSLTWPVVPGALAYNLYWSTSPGVTAASGTKVENVTSPAMRAGLTDSTAYYFIVTSVNADGVESVASPEATATPQAAPPQVTSVPEAPRGVAASPGDGQVTLFWTAVSGAASYNLYWSTAAGVTPATGIKVASVTSPKVLSGLNDGTAYYYVVTAVNAGGESAASLEVTATPQVAALGAPQGLSASPGDAQVVLSWTTDPRATAYNLYWSTSPGVTPQTGTMLAHVTSPQTITGLTDGSPITMSSRPSIRAASRPPRPK
jgi:fibronectin type 3 domain-containing protein